MDVILIYIIYESGNQNALVPKDCSDDDRTMPWFMISWLSSFVLICIILTCYILIKSDRFYSKSATETRGEFQTLLL
jgi:disulfide bond formation protein DsbB